MGYVVWSQFPCICSFALSSCCDLEQLNYFESHYSSVKMVYQSVFSRETEPAGCVYSLRERKRERDLLAHKIVQGWNIQNLQGTLSGWRPREMFQFKAKGSFLRKLPLFEAKSVFFY